MYNIKKCMCTRFKMNNLDNTYTRNLDAAKNSKAKWYSTKDVGNELYFGGGRLLEEI